MFIRTTALTPAELKAAIVREPLVVSPDTTVIDAIAQMSGMRAICDTVRHGNAQLHLEARSSCVLVAEDEQLLGIVTERDMVLLSAQQRSLEHLAIAEVMASPVVTLRESAFTDLFLAIDLLQHHHIRHLPITDEQDRLVGIITHETLRQTSRPADLLRLRLVSEVMTSEVICAAPDSSMLAIAQLMAHYRVSSVMIVESSSSPTEPLQIPVGIVTERDIVQFQALALNLQTNLAQSVMSTPIFSVRTDDSLWTVQQKMEQHSIRRLAVTGEQGELLGIITQTSLLQALNPLELYKLAEMLEKKVVRLETEKVQLLGNLLEQQVEARTAALNAKVQREKLVAALAAQIRSSLSLQTILDTTVEQVRQVLGCDRVNIWQFEADWQTIAVAESTDSSLSLLGERIDDTCFKQEQAEIYRQGHFRVVTDTSTTEMSDCHRELLIRLQTRAKIIVPLLCGDKLWGLLNASESQHPREWQPEEVKLLQALSLHLAIALQQATTHQKLQEELRERQQAEAYLRESEQRYATLAAAAPVGIFRTDVAGLCTYANDRYFHIAGIAPTAALGNGWQQALHPEDRDWVIAQWDRFIEDGNKGRGEETREENHSFDSSESNNSLSLPHPSPIPPHPPPSPLPHPSPIPPPSPLSSPSPQPLAPSPFFLEYRFQRPDGGVTWVYGQSVAERDANGETIGYLGTVTDITDRKLAEAHLQASEERYATLVEAAPVGIFRTDAEGNCIYVNDRWCQISGLNPKTAAGTGWRQGLHPDDREAIATEWQQSIQENRPFQLEYRFQRSDGGVTWVYGQSVAELDVEGQVIGYVGTVTDISDRKLTEAALIQSEAQSRALITAIPDLIMRIDRAGIYLEFVTTYSSFHVLGNLPKIVGTHVSTSLPPEQAQKRMDFIQRALEMNSIQIYEQELCIDGRKQIEEVRVVPYSKDEVLALVRDISDRKLTEAALIQSEAQSRAILAAIPDFMFRTDVNGIYQGGVTPNREIDFLPPDFDTAGSAIVDIVPPDIAARHLHYLHQALQTGELQVYEQEVQIEGRLQYEEVRVVKSGENEALFMIRDISDRKQAELQLHQLNQQLEAKVQERTQELWQVNSLQRAILDGADYSIISTDPNGIIQTFNAGAERMLGYSAAEMVGKVTPARLHDINEVIARAALLSVELGQDIPPGFEVFVAKARQGIVSEEEWSYIRKDGYQFPVWLSITALKDVNREIIGFLGIAKDISDRKRAEAELQKLSDRLALSLKSGAIGCWEWDIAQNILFGDERMYELFSIPKSFDCPIAYEMWANKLHPDDRISTETLLHEAVLGQAEYNIEYRIVDPDGSIRFIKGNGVVIRDAQGNPQSMFGINFDISDRKQAELERQKLSERLALSLKSAAIGCWEWNIVQNALLWDERMYELYGVTKSSDSRVVYDIWANGLHPDDRLSNETLIQQAVLGEAEFDTEFRVVHPDGSIHFIKAYGVVARDAQGNPQSMIGVNFDISDRKQAEIERQQLIQELSAFKLALDQSAIVVITDIKGAITYVNDRFCEISGYSRDELLGHTHSLVNSGYHSPDFFQNLWGIISRGQIWRGEVCNRAKNGSIYWVASTIVPFLDEGGRPFQYLAIRFDITARKLVEETLQQENTFRQQIVENMAEGLCVFHEVEEFPFIHFTVWNQQMQAITGYTLDEINRLGWYQTLYLNPEAQQVAIACLLQMREGQSIIAQEREIQRQDGQKRTISISTSMLSSKDEQNYILALIQDITDRKQTEQAMTQQLAAIEAAIDGIGIMQGEGYLYLNQAHLELFGYKHPEELVGKTWKSLYSPEELERFEREVFPMLGRDRAWQGEAIATRKDGSTFTEGLSLTLTDDGLLICICRDISDRKQIEAQLAESETKFRRLVEEGNDVIWSCQTDGILVYLSPQFKTIFGWDESEWIGKPFMDLVHPEDRLLVANDYGQNVKVGKKSSNSEFRHRHRDGNYVWVRTSATPAIDAKGVLVSIQGILSDISDRKQTELALQSSEIRFRRVFDSSIVGMVFADFQGKIIDANDRFLQMVGYTKQELDAGIIHWDAMTPPEYLPADIAAMEHLMQHGAIAPWEKEYYRKDGSRISVLMGAALLPGSEDQTICVLVDISDRKQAEKALQESQQFLQTVLDTIPLPLFWKNRESVFLGCNHQLAKSLSLTLTSDIIGKTDFELSPIEAQAIAYRASDRRVMESGEGDLGIEETLILPSGEQRLIETHKAPLLDWADNVIGVVGMFQDITDRKQAEQIIQQQAQRETLLREITGRIRKSLDLQTIFETATQEIRRFLQADRVGIFKFNRESGFNDGEFVSESVAAEFMSVLEIRVHDRCFGEQFSELYQQGRIQATDDIQNATLSDCHKDILSQFQVRANLILPLLGGKELWGLLCIHQCSSPRHWQQTEINFIQEITNQLAIAIQQADLYEQVQSELVIRKQAEEAIALQLQRQRTLGAIVQQIRESLDIKQILATVTQQVKEILRGDRIIVFRLFGDGRSQIVEEAVSSEFIALKERHWNNESWSQEILEYYWQGNPRIVPDVMTDIWTNCLLEYSIEGQIQSKIVAPILQEVRGSENHRWIAPEGTNKLWGVLVVHACGEKRVWEESEAQLLQQIANQLAIAIQQASLFEQLQEELLERQQAQQQITERNQELAISNEELARATRLKDEFLANMSHELRTPLNAILGMTEGLQDGVFGIVNDPQIKALQTIERSGSHLLELINDILDVAKIESGQMELEYTSVSISRLCQSSLAFIKQQALKKRLQLEIKLPTNVPDLLIDERRIRQVLINLLNNAVKFTPEGGRITLEVSHQRRTEGQGSGGAEGQG
ncbi:PAS domain S-box protein, partial [Kamptonema sp. PCC 6506]|uniref:PAS domain S-box protein n=1 Tax=Kamptonema sp. PCC 6506 TaxID=272129 RepID=UPI000A03775D